jgi:hypothetical protein
VLRRSNHPGELKIEDYGLTSPGEPCRIAKLKVELRAVQFPVAPEGWPVRSDVRVIK